MELVEKKKGSSPVWVYYGFKTLEDGSIDETSPISHICVASIAIIIVIEVKYISQ